MGRTAVIDADRITLPREFRKRARIRKGDVLDYKVENGSLVLSKRPIFEDSTRRMFGIASDISRDLSGDVLLLEETRTKLRRSK